MAAPLVQSVPGSFAALSTKNQALTNSTIAGNLLVLVADNTGASPVITSITDTQGNTWQAAPIAQSDVLGVEMWYAANTAGGPCTVTINFTTTETGDFFIQEYSGVYRFSPADQHTNADNITGTAMTTGNMPQTLYQSELLVCAGVVHSATATVTVGANFANLATRRSAVTSLLFIEDQVVQTEGAYAGVATCSSSSAPYGILIQSFRNNLAMPNNYQGVKAPNGMSVTELIR